MMSEMAQALGKTSDAQAYGQLFTNICAAFQSNFVAADGTVARVPKAATRWRSVSTCSRRHREFGEQTGAAVGAKAAIPPPAW
jgi:hypothetical protein